MSTFISAVSNLTALNSARQIVEFTGNLAQATGSYDLCTTSGGDLLIEKVVIYMVTAALTLTSITIQSNDSTPFVILNAADGAVANLLLGKTITTTWPQIQPFTLRNTKKIQFTIVGLTGSGSMKVSFLFAPITAGAILS